MQATNYIMKHIIVNKGIIMGKELGIQIQDFKYEETIDEKADASGGAKDGFSGGWLKDKKVTEGAGTQTYEATRETTEETTFTSSVPVEGISSTPSLGTEIQATQFNPQAFVGEELSPTKTPAFKDINLQPEFNVVDMGSFKPDLVVGELRHTSPTDLHSLIESVKDTKKRIKDTRDDMESKLETFKNTYESKKKNLEERVDKINEFKTKQIDVVKGNYERLKNNVLDYKEGIEMNIKSISVNVDNLKDEFEKSVANVKANGLKELSEVKNLGVIGIDGVVRDVLSNGLGNPLDKEALRIGDLTTLNKYRMIANAKKALTDGDAVVDMLKAGGFNDSDVLEILPILLEHKDTVDPMMLINAIVNNPSLKDHASTLSYGGVKPFIDFFNSSAKVTDIKGLNDALQNFFPDWNNSLVMDISDITGAFKKGLSTLNKSKDVSLQKPPDLDSSDMSSLF